MNKRGMFAQLLMAIVVITIAIALVPTIMEQVNLATQNTASSAYYNNSLTWPLQNQNLISILPVLIGVGITIAVIAMIYSALRDAGLVGRRKPRQKDEDEEETEEEDEDEEDEYDEEDEDDEEEEEVKQKPKLKCSNRKKEDEEIKHGTIITTINKDGTKRPNVKIGPGYHVDQYALDKSDKDSSLTITEDNFKKTKYD